MQKVPENAVSCYIVVLSALGRKAIENLFE